MENHSRPLKLFLAFVVFLSVVTVANIVGYANFLHKSFALRYALSLSAGSSAQRGRETQEQAPAATARSSIVSAAPSGESSSPFPSRTFVTGSAAPDTTRGRLEPAVTGSASVNTTRGRSELTVTGSVSVNATRSRSVLTVTGSVTVNATTSRPIECDGCFRPDYHIIISNPGICAGDPDDVIDLLVVITTVHDHQRARQAQRDTWLSVARSNRGRVRYVYLLGESFNDTATQTLLKENATYGDLLMEGFKDTYRNLTLKTLMGLKWAVTSCPRARYVMKTDDDMWVNVKAVLNLTSVHSKALETRVAGACRGRGFPFRQSGSKWHTSMADYPQSSFPAFCSGTAYVTSMAAVRRIVSVSPHVPFFYLEDIYVGLCLRKLGLSVLSLPGFFYRRTSQDPCFLQSAKVVTSHQVAPDVLVKAWSARCANSTI